MVGRYKEKSILQEALISSEAEMIAVVGRRRVGKTFLVRTVYSKIDFELIGVPKASLGEQLQHFSIQLKPLLPDVDHYPRPSSWLEAFNLLKVVLEKQEHTGKQILFFDELPWLASPRSGFLEALGYFWNSWASKSNVIVVISGSAASWMIRKVIHHKGGLHNRITRIIYLSPFTLSETEEYLISRSINLDRYQILLLYMCMGGVPHYLKEIRQGMSAIQLINKICFSVQGLLFDEFDKLYPSLFDRPQHHIAVVRALASKAKGMSHAEIAHHSGVSSGGTLSTILDELIQSGFISGNSPLQKKKKDTLFRLTDQYSLFYLRFIEGHSGREVKDHTFFQTQQWITWTGYAFENVALSHVGQIKESLQVGGMYSTQGSYILKAREDQPGIQLDFLIDRSDQAINICEAKYYNTEYEVSAAEAKQLRSKIAVFRAESKTRKHVFLTLVTTYGLKANKHSIGLIDQVITQDDLFVIPKNR